MWPSVEICSPRGSWVGNTWPVQGPSGTATVGRIPFALRIGVTGHRTVANEEEVAGALDEALTRLIRRAEARSSSRVTVTVVSALAEGADRLVVDRVLARPGSRLEAVLPLPPDEYVGDFDAGSRAVFCRLLAAAAVTSLAPPSASRDVAYQTAGDLMLDRSDVLIAIWDGQPPRGLGGTATVVAGAQTRGLPVIWIDPAAPSVVHEQVDYELLDGDLARLGRFNRSPIDPTSFEAAATRRSAELMTVMETAELDGEAANRLLEWNVPPFVRADWLAGRFQRVNQLLADSIFVLASLALTTVAAQLVFFPEDPFIAWIEVGLLAVLLALLGLGRGYRVHERWLAYRLLAERIRAGLFIAAAGAEAAADARSERIYSADADERFVKRAFKQIWLLRPADLEIPPSVAATFVVSSWLDEQRRYFERSMMSHRTRSARFDRLAILCFGLTLLAAAVHGAGVGHAAGRLSPSAQVVAFASIALPAAGVALAGIRNRREYERNAERSESMIRHLEDASQLLRGVSPSRLASAVAEVDLTLLDENRDWYLGMRPHPPRLPA